MTSRLPFGMMETLGQPAAWAQPMGLPLQYEVALGDHGPRGGIHAHQAGIQALFANVCRGWALSSLAGHLITCPELMVCVTKIKARRLTLAAACCT